jgi:hypothetical protein
MTTRVTPADFEALVRANPDAVVEVDRATSRYYLRTASRVTVWTPALQLDAHDDLAMERACAAEGRAS